MESHYSAPPLIHALALGAICALGLASLAIETSWLPLSLAILGALLVALDSRKSGAQEAAEDFYDYNGPRIFPRSDGQHRRG
ncbi:MAG: hypothetical protein KGJ13_06940 [Patescibacteria group bacterium]|nr:hypothetical protein [Patescibacteria group bacterium]